VLRDSHELQFDRKSEVFLRHPLTTEDIKESCRDLKVVGARELKQLVKWREKMRTFLEEVGSEGEEERDGKDGEGVSKEGEGLEGIDDKVKALASKESAAMKRLVGLEFGSENFRS
jgi:AdoMet-dependent rRNA methyltransferase SPB1